MRASVCIFTRIWRGNGTGLFAQGLVEGMLAHGVDTLFICPRTTTPAMEETRPGLTRIRQPREADGAPKLVRVAASLVRMAGGALALARARLSTRLFVISLPDPFIVAIPVLWLLRLSGATVLLVAHDPVPHAWKLPARLRGMERFGYRTLYRVVSGVVVLSEPTRLKLEAAFPRAARHVAVIDHGPFVMGDVGAAPGAGRLLCFGTLRRNKGILEAMAAVAALHAEGQAVSLLVAGGPHKEDPAYADECVAFARTVPGCVELRCDYVADDAVGALLADSDALLMPYTDFHSQSGVALLAASNARPVIASAAGGLSTLLDEGMPGVRIAEPVSAATIAEAVRLFFRTPARIWNGRAEAYRARTLEQRSWPRIAGRYLAFAQEIGGRHLSRDDASGERGR